MKKILFLSLFISFKMFGQSVLLTPNTISKQSNSSFDDITLTKYGVTPVIINRTANGTVAAPTALILGNDFSFFGGRGHTGSFFTGSSSAAMIFRATQDWTNTANGASIAFATTSNNNVSDTRSDRMIINHDGKVGIGLVSPNQILDINGRMRIRHTPGFTSGVWMSNSTNSLSDADGAFIGLENDNQAGIWINNAWRFGFKSNGNAVITGFTQLGNSTPAGASPGATAPAIKTLKLTGTTAGTAGASISVDHGLGNRLKILGYTVLVVGTSAVSYPPEYTYNGGYQYSTTCSNTQILIINSHLNSANIYNKAFTVLITYEE